MKGKLDQEYQPIMFLDHIASTIILYICSFNLFVLFFTYYNAGATLGKGLNRGLGTLLAGSLAFLVEYVADIPGRIFQAVFIGSAVFLLGKYDQFSR